MSIVGKPTKPGNRTLAQAKRAKQDEFYTQLADIENELKHYKPHFKGKVVLCNCDDPYESNFFKYFAMNFNALGLKRLITTSYDGSPIAGQGVLFPEYHAGNSQRQKPKAIAVFLDQVQDENGDGAVTLDDVELFLQRNQAARQVLNPDGKYPGGDFRSKECIEILKQADIVVTNPPFSLFREYVAQLVEHGKQFLIIGNKNAITYKEIFKLIKENQLWIGVTPMGKDMLFDVPDDIAREMVANGKEGSNYKIVNGKVMGRSTSTWFTNIDNLKRHEFIPLYKKYSPEAYPKYDNYDAIEVSKVSDIPVDYDGAMGVPISFLDKYNPEQFEILWTTDRGGDGMLEDLKKPHSRYDAPVVNGKGLYKRIFIRHKRIGRGEK